MRKILTLAIILLLVLSTFSILAPQVKASGNDSLEQSYFWQGYGGYTANGIGLFVRDPWVLSQWQAAGMEIPPIYVSDNWVGGDIVISDIPEGATVEAAFLYWCTWEEISPPSTSVTVNGIPVDEELIGTATEADLLWWQNWPITYRGYRADISSIVMGNGVYRVDGFPTSQSYTEQNTMGASIVVIYSLPMAPKVTIIINDGMVALHARPQSYTTEFSGFVVPPEPSAQITFIAGQAEPYWTLDWEYFNGKLLAQNGLQGSDGPLWDTDTYDVSSYISEGDFSATATIAMQDDWIGWVAAIFQVKVPPPEMPPKFLTLPFRDPDIVVGWIFDPTSDPPHYGIDFIKCVDIYDVDTWQSFGVVAAADGEAFRAEQKDWGSYVFIRHYEKDAEGRSYYTLYAHLESVNPKIPKEGDSTYTIERGEFVGIAGDTVSSGLIHLHFEVHKGDARSIAKVSDRVDPYDLNQKRGSRYGEKATSIKCGLNYLWTTDPPTLPVSISVSSFGAFITTRVADTASLPLRVETSRSGQPVSGARVFTADSSLILGTTDTNGVVEARYPIAHPPIAGDFKITIKAEVDSITFSSGPIILYTSRWLGGGGVTLTEDEARWYAAFLLLRYAAQPGVTAPGLWGTLLKLIDLLAKVAYDLRDYQPQAGDYITYALYEYTSPGVETAYCYMEKVERSGEEIYNRIWWTNDYSLVKPYEVEYIQRAAIVGKLASPATLYITDPAGRHAGVNPITGEQVFEFPVVMAEDNEGHLWLIIPSPLIGDYTFTIIGTGEGTYSLTLQTVDTTGYTTEEQAVTATTAVGVTHDYSVAYSPDQVSPLTITLLAAIDFDPDTLNLKSKDKWVTVYIELPEGYDISQIDVSSIRLNGTVPALAKPTSIGDYDGDGIPDLMVKFDRASVIALFSGKTVPGNYVMEVTGTVAGIRFKGTDTIRVISPP